MGTSDSLSSLLGAFTDGKVIRQLSKKSDVDPNQVNSLIQLGIPTLVQALQKNASTPTGLSSLQNALNQHASDPIDDVSSFLSNVDLDDGSKIIGHILGSKTSTIQSKLGSQTGIPTDQVGTLLNSLAPLLMGTLAKQNSVSSSPDLSGLLGGLLGGSGNDMAKMAMGLLDTDHDGDVMDDVGQLLGGFLKKK